MGKARGQVKFRDTIKFFVYNSTEDICKPKLYDTFDEMLDNWRKPYVSIEVNNITYDKKSWFKKIFRTNKDKNREQSICNHSEEPVELYTDYGGGFYWNGTACRKCNMILKGREPFELPVEDRHIDGIPDWAEDFDSDVITISNLNSSYINPFEIEDDNYSREEIISNFKEFLTQHYKFAKEYNEQKISLSDIQKMCVKNDFIIADEELLKIISECEENTD